MNTAYKKVDKTKSPSTTFVVFALDMSWRLAIAVLAPIIIGNKLDNSLRTSPWLTITGFLLAVLGAVLIIRSTIKKADAAIAAADNGGKHE